MTTVRRSKHRRGTWTKIFGWGPPALGALRRGHLRHGERAAGPHAGAARQLPAPGHVRRVGVRTRPFRRDHHPAAVPDVRRRGGARGARRIARGELPAAAVVVDVLRRRLHRGGGQAACSRLVRPPPADQDATGRRRARSPVGLGFAAFESAGYALVASFTVHGLSLVDLVSTELLRGLLTPFGHAVWIRGGPCRPSPALTLASSPPTRIDPRAANCGNGLGPSGGSGAAPPAPAGPACPAKPTLPPAVATSGLMPVTRAARDASNMSIRPAGLKLRVARTAARAGHPVPVRPRRPTK